MVVGERKPVGDIAVCFATNADVLRLLFVRKAISIVLYSQSQHSWEGHIG